MNEKKITRDTNSKNDYDVFLLLIYRSKYMTRLDNKNPQNASSEPPTMVTVEELISWVARLIATARMNCEMKEEAPIIETSVPIPRICFCGIVSPHESSSNCTKNRASSRLVRIPPLVLLMQFTHDIRRMVVSHQYVRNCEHSCVKYAATDGEDERDPF